MPPAPVAVSASVGAVMLPVTVIEGALAWNIAEAADAPMASAVGLVTKMLEALAVREPVLTVSGALACAPMLPLLVLRVRLPAVISVLAVAGEIVPAA